MTLKFVSNGRTSQALSYLLKLLLFLHVPGLHLLALGKKRTGLLLLIPLLAGMVIMDAMPFKASHSWYFGLQVVILMFFLATFLSFIFIVFDLANLSHRGIETRSIIIAMIYLTAFYWPGDSEQLENTELYLAFDQQMCPEICFGEFAAYTPVRETSEMKTIPAIGDIVVYEIDQGEFASRILATAGQAVCIDEQPEVLVENSEKSKCKVDVLVGPEQFYVFGNDNAPGKWDQNVHQGLISSSQLIGINPVVVANWSEALSATFSTAEFLGDIYYRRD